MIVVTIEVKPSRDPGLLSIHVISVENRQIFSRPEPSVFLYLTRPFLYFWDNLKKVWNTGRRFLESKQKQDGCFSAHICRIPYLVGIFPYLFRITNPSSHSFESRCVYAEFSCVHFHFLSSFCFCLH